MMYKSLLIVLLTQVSDVSVESEMTSIKGIVYGRLIMTLQRQSIVAN